MSLDKYYEMDLDDLREREYDAQFFGFTIEDFMISIKLLVKEDVTRFTELMTNALIKKYSSDDPEIEEVKEITKTLINQYICASVEPLKTLQSQLKELLHIPSHVLLPGDQAQQTQYSANDEQEIDEQINNLLTRIKRTKAFDHELRQELKTLRDALPLVTQMVRDCESLVTDQQEGERVLQSLQPAVEEMVTNGMQLLALQNTSPNIDNQPMCD